MTFAPSTNQVSDQASLISYPYSGKLLVVNRDLNNTVYIGGDQGVSATNPNTYGTIDPLGTITFDDPQQLFAVCAKGQSATVEVIPDAESFSVSPATIATQISESGIALIDNPKPIYVQNPISITAGNSADAGPFLVNQFQSWFLSYQPLNTAQGSSPYVLLNLAWSTDAAGLVITHSEKFLFKTSAVSNPVFFYFGHGPMYGQYLNISLTNYDTVTSTFVFELFGSNRVVTETNVRSYASPGTTQGFGDDDILYFENNTSLANGATSTLRFANMFNGLGQLRIRVTGASGLGVVNFMMNDEPASDEGGFNSLIVSLPQTSTTVPQPDYLQQLLLPKRHTSFQVTNGGTTPISYRIWLTAKGATT